MSSRVEWRGMSELIDALRKLPEELAADAGVIVQSAAAGAQNEIVRNYPDGPTGNLKRRVTLETEKTRFGAAAIVRSRAPHASIFERGTEARRTGRGWNRGRMPQPPESQRMIPVVIRKRRQMIEQLIELVRRAGFQVEAT